MMGTRSIGRAQGSPTGLHCLFCSHTGVAQGTAQTSWIPKAMAGVGDYSAAQHKDLEAHGLCLHSQALGSELPKTLL